MLQIILVFCPSGYFFSDDQIIAMQGTDLQVINLENNRLGKSICEMHTLQLDHDIYSYRRHAKSEHIPNRMM